MTGSHKVVGSIPISSTKGFKGLGSWDFPAAFLLLSMYVNRSEAAVAMKQPVESLSTEVSMVTGPFPFLTMMYKLSSS